MLLNKRVPYIPFGDASRNFKFLNKNVPYIPLRGSFEGLLFNWVMLLNKRVPYIPFGECPNRMDKNRILKRRNKT